MAKDLRERHRGAHDVLAATVAAVTDDDRARPTPCTDWDVDALLAHLAGQARGTALALAGGGADRRSWQPDPVTGVPEVRAGLRLAQLAAAEADPGASVWMPEVQPARPIPVGRLLGFTLLDAVVHAWDLASALGRPLEVPADVLAEARSQAEQIPTGDLRTAPGAPFAPGLALDGDDLTVLLALTGRDPGWAPPLAP